MQNIQSLIENRAEEEVTKKIRDLFEQFEKDIPCSLYNTKVTFEVDNKNLTLSARGVLAALKAAITATAIPQAQEQAAKDFLAKVERLSSEIEDLQSQIS